MDKSELQGLQEEIFIKGARTNNLKNIDLHLPKNKLIVVTGVSGSGKSSLVIDTLYAEGQRRYVESMSAYARQFLGRMKKPDVDFIRGIAPAIAIEQKVSSSNARSTVGTLTEIYDYLRLFFARAGETLSPVSGEKVKKHQVSDVVDYVRSHPEESRILLFAPLHVHDGRRSFKQELELLLQKGFTRIYMDEEMIQLEDLLHEKKEILKLPAQEMRQRVQVLVDRIVVNEDPENLKRIADSINTAFYEGAGECSIEVIEKEKKSFNNRFELDGIQFIEPSPQLFNYNNPFGACPRCEGFGQIMGIDPSKVVPDTSLSVYDGAIACWKGEKNGLWLDRLVYSSEQFGFPIYKAYEDLSEDHKQLLWTGNRYFKGIDSFFEDLQEKSYKIQNRVMIARYRGRTICPECRGGRLRKEAQYVKIDGKSMADMIHAGIGELKHYIDNLKLTENQAAISKRILLEIKTRLDIMNDIGLSYLSLDRPASSLSGGETQRINLTRTLGSNLTSSLYILDEPSVGLHPRDTARLVEVLRNLRDLGNTVIVVEHEEEVIRSADYLVDVGPHAGLHGGEIVFAGPFEKLSTEGSQSLTAKYLFHLNGKEDRQIRRAFVNKIQILGAAQHNLKSIDVSIPLNALVVVTGVSGSGKTSLIQHIFYPAMLKELQISHPSKIGKFKSISGDLNMIRGIEMINQNPIGRSSRSNPVTYVKAYDEIRKLMVKQQLSKIRGYKPKHFSFNTEGGRCENCQGDGNITVEMQFLADVHLVCEDCNGKRFKQEILEVQYNGKNIYDILDLSVSESLDFFKKESNIIKKLQPLEDVGLGYVKLGQASSTLSGGEAQRVKLASFLIKDNEKDHQLFIFDEPTTGLHFDDINKLLTAFNALIEKGNTVVVVEHNLDVIRNADWLIDLGPEGGHEGGKLVFQGYPEDLIHVAASYTGKFLKEKMKQI